MAQSILIRKADGTFEFLKSDGSGRLEAAISGITGTVNAQLTGSIPGDTLEEQLTEADAALGVLTFSANIVTVEIFNTDDTNTGVFNVNGIDIAMPPDTAFKATVQGVASAEVTVTGATTYIVSRYS